MDPDAAVVDDTPDVATDAPADTTSESQSPEPASSPAPEAAAAPAAPQRSVWDSFKNLDEFRGQDDLAIARRLYSAMEREKAVAHQLRQYQQYMPYAQQYLQHREPFERYLAAQSAAPQQPAQPVAEKPAQPKWWSPPEVRESFKQYLVKDENGREVISQDAPPDAKHALYEYQKYKADFAQKFLTDPEAALGPMVQEQAQKIAEQIVSERFAEQQQDQYVSSLEKEHSAWLYEADGKTPTPEGLAVQNYVEEAARMGIRDPQDRWNYAASRVELDLHNRLRELGQQSPQMPAPQQFQPPVAPPATTPSAQPDAVVQAQKDIEFLRREASRNPSRAAGSSDPKAAQAPLTFEQRLAKQLSRDGIL